jgi:hypothetical protein
MRRVAMQAGDRSVDNFRAINAITLRGQIVFDLASGRKFLAIVCII